MRVPREASEYIYNNYEVGDIVIVFDANDIAVMYNYQNNELIYTYKK